MKLTYEFSQTELSKALERNEFLLFYQPKINLSSGKIEGIEALIRWNHPQRGLLLPGEFISVAEETGLILPIGEWVLRTACLQNKKWQDEGLPPMVISVNLSVRQLYQPNLVDTIQQILIDTKLEPKYLEFEITESIMMDVNGVLGILKEVKNIGVQISLDDFGTGYNSLHYLKELPIDKIKLDQSFIFNCITNLNDAIIVKTIITMARHLKIKVVAEGIENKEQLVFLQQNFCDFGQGYLFSKPITSEELIRNFDLIEQTVFKDGLSQKICEKGLLHIEQQNFYKKIHNIVKNQEGMIFKLIEKGGRFIYTFCDGNLLYKMGLTPQQVVGKELRDFISEDRTEYFRRVLEYDENIVYEGELNGIHFFAFIRLTSNVGQVKEFIGSCVEIPESKRASEVLENSNLKYQFIADNIIDLIFIGDKDGKVFYASPSYEKLFGFPIEKYEQYNIYQLIHPEDIPIIKRQLSNSIESRKSSQIEFRHKQRSGKWSFIEAKVNPVYDENGEIEYMISVWRDVTERKNKEKLVQEFERITVAQQLASTVAQKIRDPLTIIMGYVQLLQKDVGKSPYIDNVLNEIQTIEDIIQRFVEFSHPQITQMKKTDIKSLLQQVLNLYSKNIVQKVVISENLNLEMLNIYCDENQIKQVFKYILKNTIECMPNGGIIKVEMVNVATDHIRIRFINQEIKSYYYSVKERFIEWELMFCQRIMREHGGEIDVKREDNIGNVIDLILPVEHSNM